MRLRSDGKIEGERAIGSPVRSSAPSAAAPGPELPPRLAAVDPAQAQRAAAVAARGQPRREEAAPGLLSRAAHFLGLAHDPAPRVPSNAIVLPPGVDPPAATMSSEQLERLRRAAEPVTLPQHDRDDGRLRISHPRAIIGVRG